MSRTATFRSHRKLPGRFEDLVGVLPPRAIADQVDYENTIEMLDRLTSIARLSKGQERYLETLSVLVAAYESERHAIETDDLSPIQVLEHLLEANGMNASQLGELLGNRALGSKILRGQRELSKNHIRILARRFNVSPSLFF
jgi:HTH-type transcriptional regulator / antitoxin HigA